jgi:hypothetical protein
VNPTDRRASREAARKDVKRAPLLTHDQIADLRRLIGGPRRSEQPEDGAA